MTRLGFLLFAAVARLLWAVPVWCALVVLAGIGVGALVEGWRFRARRKAFRDDMPTDAQEVWEQCHARKKTSEGFEVECVKRAGHDGDDAQHLGSRDDLYWSGN